MKEPNKFWIKNEHVHKDWPEGELDYVLAGEYELLKILYADIEAQRNRLADEIRMGKQFDDVTSRTNSELQQELGSLNRHLIKAWFASLPEIGEKNSDDAGVVDIRDGVKCKNAGMAAAESI